MTHSFHYKTRSSSWAPLFMAALFGSVGGGLYAIGSFFEIFGQIFLALASFFFLVCLIYFFAPKIKYVQVSSEALSVFFGMPWAQETISFPLSSIESAEICKSPFHYVTWLINAGPHKTEEEQDVIRLKLSPPLPSSQVEYIKGIKKNPLPIFHFAVDQEGEFFYIKASPKEGLENLLNVIQQCAQKPSNQSQELTLGAEAVHV